MIDAPIGAEAVDTADSTPDLAQAPAAGSEPKPFDVSEDTLINIKGQTKPVKFGEHVKGFQSQFTKASQRAAQLEKELANERSQRQRYEQERQAAAQGQQKAGQPDVFDALAQLPYLTGKDAVSMVKEISGAIQQRDQVLIAALRKLQDMEKMLGGLNESHTTERFDQKINKWLVDGGYPIEAGDLAKEIYLAYDGDDLDAEFPRIFEERWQQINKIIEGQKAQKVAAARRIPFVPGRGGQGNPSKPLEVKANATAREVADQLFGTWSGQDT